MPASIAYHGQSTLPDGRVLVSGGSTIDWKGGYVSTVYIYTPSTNTWISVASLATVLYSHGQSTLLDGRVLISGGSNGGNRNTVYIYDTNNDKWMEVESLSTKIAIHGQSTLADGRIIISGGNDGGGTPTPVLNTTYIYTPSTNIWKEAVPLTTNIWQHRQSTLINGNVLVSGGITGSNALNTTYIYASDDYIGSWVSATPIPTAVRYHGQSTLLDGRVLISGGSVATGFETVYVYMPDNNKWATLAPLATGNSLHGQSTLADGRVLITGGTSNGTTTAFNTAYIYTPTGWRKSRVLILAYKIYQMIRINYYCLFCP